MGQVFKFINPKVDMSLRVLSLIFISLFIFSFVSAEPLFTFQRNSTIDLKQGCDDSTYSNITKIVYLKDSTSVLDSEVSMSSYADNQYNYQLNSTNLLGIYNVYGHCDEDGARTEWWYDFEVTPSGESGNSNIAFFVFIFVLLYGLNMFGFFGRVIPLTIISGMALLFLGIYIVTNGVIIYQNNLTNYIAYITIAWGFISSMWAILEQFDVI